MSAFVVAENDDVKVIFRPGKSEFLLVTFGDLFTDRNNLEFFACIPAEKLNLSCIGLIAKSGNWYPEASITQLFPAMEPYLNKYISIVGYGGSMGGYAAIKYSGLFYSTCMIALCPQWSIDLNECDGFDPGWQDYFQSPLTGMGIKSSDVHGDIYVLYDEFNATDSFHAGRISKVSGAMLINVPHVGHNVTPVVAGTSYLVDLINSCREGNANAIRAIVRQSRVLSPHRITKLQDFAKTRFPRMMKRSLISKFENNSLKKEDVRLAFSIASAYKTNGDFKKAVRVYVWYAVVVRDLAKIHMFALFIAENTDYVVALNSYHNTFLCYDIETDKIIHVNRATSTNIPLHVSIGHEAACMWFNVSHERYYIRKVDEDLKITTKIEEATLFECELSQGDYFYLRSDDRYVSAEAGDQHISCDRVHAYSWEMFRLGFQIANQRQLTSFRDDPN